MLKAWLLVLLCTQAKDQLTKHAAARFVKCGNHLFVAKSGSKVFRMVFDYKELRMKAEEPLRLFFRNAKKILEHGFVPMRDLDGQI